MWLGIPAEVFHWGAMQTVLLEKNKGRAERQSRCRKLPLLEQDFRRIGQSITSRSKVTTLHVVKSIWMIVSL